jgi:hypothetical protein
MSAIDIYSGISGDQSQFGPYCTPTRHRCDFEESTANAPPQLYRCIDPIAI